MGLGKGTRTDSVQESIGGGARETLKRVFSRHKYDTLQNEAGDTNTGGRSIEVLPEDEECTPDHTQWTKIEISNEDIEIKQGKIKSKKSKRKEKRKRIKKSLWRKTKGGWKCFKAGMVLISSSAIGAFSFTGVVQNTATMYANYRRPV